MHYLIDGHNLIARLPEISLDDPHDEAKLVIRLRSWAAARRKHQVTVYFDHGLPGGEARNLSTSQVKVIFASTGRKADELLIKQIERLRNPGAYTVVTSDREILAAAPRALRLMSAEAFAAELARMGRTSTEVGPVSPAEPDLSPDEVDEWLDIFSGCDRE